MAIGSLINDYRTKQLANKALGRPTDFRSGFSNKSLNDLRNEIDVNNDRNSKADFLENSPESDEDYFLVPKIIE